MNKIEAFYLFFIALASIPRECTQNLIRAHNRVEGDVLRDGGDDGARLLCRNP